MGKSLSSKKDRVTSVSEQKKIKKIENQGNRNERIIKINKKGFTVHDDAYEARNQMKRI